MILLASLAAITLQSAAPAETPPGAHPVIAYRLTVTERAPGEVDARISIDFDGDADGETEIELPSEWGGESELWNAIAELSVSGDGASLHDTEAPDRRLIRHAPGARLVIEYRIAPDRPGEPDAAAGDYYRPYVRPGYVHLLGTTTLIQPPGLDEAELRFDYDIPAGWTFASDLEHGVEDNDDLIGSIMVAGDFRVLSSEIDGAPVRLAMRGDIGVSDEGFAASVDAALRASHAYWGAPGEPFLVTVLPLNAPEGWSSLGGTGLGDAFAFFATPNAEAERIVTILQHEHLHSWNPQRLGGSIDGEAEPAGYWFSEGFTDFLTQRVGVLGGVWDAAAGLGYWNESLAEYAASPLIDAPNSVITERFWSDPDAQRLPYMRGMLFAALIDHEIRRHTDGAMDLDDVLFAMRDGMGDGPAPDRFADVVRAVTGLDIAGHVERHIDRGEPVWLPDDVFGACGPLETVEEPVFVYGMTLGQDADGRNVIATVDPDGPAAPAGFAPGMIILGRLEGAVGDASVDSVLRVETPEGEVADLRYRPTNGEHLVFQRIAPPGPDFDAEACAARLAGRDT